MAVNRVIVDLSAIEGNLKHTAARLAPGARVIAVVKADAYGHGMVPVAKRVMAAGASMLAVAQVEEGAALRREGIDAPVLVMGGLLPEAAEDLLAYSLIPAIYAPPMVYALERAAARLGRKAPVHLKVETGMNRLGARPGPELAAVLSALQACPHVQADGAFSHFAMAEDAGPYTGEQMGRFGAALAQAQAAGITPLRHIGNSAAALRLPAAHFDAVRLGIALYGLDPAGGGDPGLVPALSWHTRVVHVKDVEAGEAVSYGCTWRAPGRRRIATLPVGYADGYRRALGGKAAVLVGGRRAPVIGRVCMDHCMADVTGIAGVEPGSDGVLIGSQGEETITAQQMADWLGTIHYEVVTGIGKREPRLYVG